jgi:hypothetical protein
MVLLLTAFPTSSVVMQMWSTPVRLCSGSPDIADWCVLRAIELEDLKADTAPCARYAIFLFYNAML